MKIRLVAVLAAALSVTTLAFSNAPLLFYNIVAVSDAWVREALPGQQVTGVFLKIYSRSERPLVLVDARSKVSSHAEIHEMKMEGETMKMRAIPWLDLPSNKSVDLRPGGVHIMLFGLTKPLKTGEIVPITLIFEEKESRRRGTVLVEATVKAISAH